MRRLHSSRAAFSLLELLIVVTTIGVLAVMLVVNTIETRAVARDTNRRANVDAYVISMQQYRDISPNKSYFVTRKSAAPICTVTNGNIDGGHMEAIGADCVGLNGGSGGKITRKGVAPYGTVSIAEALQEFGVLNAQRFDPIAEGGAATNIAAQDYILALCQTDGKAATSVKNAQDFAIYAILERPRVYDDAADERNDAVAAKRTCGGELTGNGWNVNP